MQQKKFILKASRTTNYTLKIWNSTITLSFVKFLWGQEACRKNSYKNFTKYAVQITQSYPIATIGTEDGFTDEIFLSQSSSTGMSASEMLATEVFTPEMSATEMSTIDTSTAEIFLIKMSANEMSTAETSAD